MRVIPMVLTDRMLFSYILDFLPGLPHALLEFEWETYASLTGNLTTYQRPSSDQLCGGAVWLHRALITENTRISELLFRLHGNKYYASLPLVCFDGVLERVCKQGTVHYLEFLHDKQPLVGATWPRGLLRVALTAYMDRLDNRDQSQERTSTDEQLRMIRWLMQHHPEACDERTPPRGRFLLAHEHCGVLEELLAAEVLEMTDIAKSPIDASLMELLLLKCPGLITPAFVMDCAMAGNGGALQVIHQHTSDLPEGLFTPQLMDKAAESGHLDVVRFLHEHRTEGCTTNAMDLAASNGHLEVVQFLHEHRTEGCTQRAIQLAAHCGYRYGRGAGRDVAMVQFFVEHRTEGFSDPTSWQLNDAVAFLRSRWATTPAVVNDPALALRAAVIRLTDVKEFEQVHAQYHPHGCGAPPDVWSDQPSLLCLAIESVKDDFATFLVNNCDHARATIDFRAVYAAGIKPRPANPELLGLLVEKGPSVDQERGQLVCLLDKAAVWEELPLVKLLLDHGVPCSERILMSAMAANDFHAVSPYLLETHPECITADVLQQVLYRGEHELFYKLHASHHVLCGGRLINEAICGEESEERTTWELLIFMHHNCPTATIDESSLSFVWECANDHVIVYLWLVCRDLEIAKSLWAADRGDQLRVFARLRTVVPSLFDNFPANVPWCCQLRMLRERVEAGELTLADVESAIEPPPEEVEADMCEGW